MRKYRKIDMFPTLLVSGILLSIVTFIINLYSKNIKKIIYDSCGEIMATSELTRNNNGQSKTLKKNNSQITIVLDLS